MEPWILADTTMSTDKPFSAACERNRDAILGILRPLLAESVGVLEIGSGTGQHAVHFARHMPHLRWQCSDRAERLPGIRLWLDEAGLPGTPAPLALDVGQADAPGRFDAVFTANTLHILPWPRVEQLFARAPQWLNPGGRLVVYGPFHRDGHATSAGNAAFDRALRSEDPAQGIRDVEAVAALAEAAGLRLEADHPMPANNRCLVWRAPTG